MNEEEKQSEGNNSSTEDHHIHDHTAVSYTHLTLPTKA